VKASPCIVIDTREQTPLTFDTLPSQVGTLDTGDYSVRGLEHLISIERKSLPDLLTCVGRERERFKRELRRLRGYRFRLLLVECSAADLECGAWSGQLKPAHVIGSLAAWSAQYSLPIWLGGDHEGAGRFAERWLYQAARCIATEYEAAARALAAIEPAEPSRELETRGAIRELT
jgi:ERCC4-type nuclease